MKRSLRLLLLYVLALAARPFVRRPAPRLARVLYIKPDHLGDLLLATPALAALRQRVPAAEITALVGPWARTILAHNPDLDRLLDCPFPGFERRPPSKPGTVTSLLQPYRLLLRYALLLRAARYDAAIIGRDDHWWGAALALLAGIPLRTGFDLPECRPFLTLSLPWSPTDHVAAQGLALVFALDQAARGRGTRAQTPHMLPVSRSPLLRLSSPARFDPAPVDHEWADAWLAEHGIAPNALVVIHPGTAGPSKLWFAGGWAAVADALAREGARVVLTGGPDEAALVAEVAETMRAEALRLAGRTSIGQLAALLRRAALVLGVDSGPLHLAAAQGTPTVHLYGPGDAGRFGPWGNPARHVVIREQLWCSPCGVFSACPRGLAHPECMEHITAARVLREAQQLLAHAQA